jgi:polyisoprenoid-binding protein YceI
MNSLMLRFGRAWVLIGLVGMALLLATGYATLAIRTSGAPDPVGLQLPEDFAPQGVVVGPPVGTWTVGPGSFAGYRIREKLAFLPAPHDVVARTTTMSGSVTVGALEISRAFLSIDTTTLTSDESGRDQAMRTQGLETDRYPRASFLLTEPLPFSSWPELGRVVTRTAAGRLTLHGVTRAVTLPLQGQWTGGEIRIAGSLRIRLADFGIVAPSAGPVSIADTGTIELQLTLVRP